MCSINWIETIAAKLDRLLQVFSAEEVIVHRSTKGLNPLVDCNESIDYRDYEWISAYYNILEEGIDEEDYDYAIEDEYGLIQDFYEGYYQFMQQQSLNPEACDWYDEQSSS